jgi:NDP-sugar pyrophosphorylase family protein
MNGASKSFILRGGVIAAGHGTRLRADGYRVSKPMTPVGGRPLIGHALDRFRAVGVRQATVIVNEGSDDCRRWLAGHSEDLDLDVIVRTTPSSYASFQLVAARLAGAPALITTVDSIMPIEAFQHFVDSAASFPDDAVVLGLTGHVDDENPLWATLAEEGRIARLGGDQGSHVTAGIYWLPAHRVAQPTTGFARLRDYLKWLVDEVRPVYGVVLPVVFDIDRAHDVETAERAGFASLTPKHGPRASLLPAAGEKDRMRGGRLLRPPPRKRGKGKRRRGEPTQSRQHEVLD